MANYEIGSADWYYNVDYPKRLAGFKAELEKGGIHAKWTNDRIKFACEDGKYAIDSDGAVHWTTNGRYVDSEVCALMVINGIEINVYNTLVKHVEQVDKELAQYRKAQMNRVRSAEEISEMRNAFGAGEKVVNVLTGEVIQL